MGGERESGRWVGLESIGEGFYRRPGIDSGPSESYPNFLLYQDANEQLSRVMAGRGYKFGVRHALADFQKNKGQMFTATFTLGRDVFEAENPSDEKVAVCLAALKAFGIQVEGTATAQAAR